MNQQKKHPIALKYGAVKFLRDMVSATGWAKDTTSIILGGRLLVDLIPEISEPPTRSPQVPVEQFKTDSLTWANTEAKPFEVTQKEYDTCRKAIEHFAAQGAVPPTPSAAELLLAFGFGGD